MAPVSGLSKAGTALSCRLELRGKKKDKWALLAHLGAPCYGLALAGDKSGP